MTSQAHDIFPLIVWMWVKKYNSSYLSEHLDLSLRAVDGHLRRIRSRIADSIPNYTGQLAGIVHVDTWAYKPRLNLAPPKRSYPPKRPLLLGMLSAGGELRLFVIPRKSQAEIYPLIKAHIVRGTRLITNKSVIYTGLRKDGFPDLVQKSPNKLNWYEENQEDEPNLYSFWNLVSEEIGAARGVRTTNYLSRVRETELRWAFREKPNVHLYKHVLALIASQAGGQPESLGV